ncbi:hypothetical protein CHUAL_010615 [Chamberlinius hualienensis]
MPFESSNDFLYTIRPLVLVLKCYGVHLADAETLRKRKVNICKRICQSFLSCLYLILISSWMYGIIQSLTKNSPEKVELCFYIILIVMSLASVTALAIFILKRNSIELMAAEIQMAFKQLDDFKFTKKTRWVSIVYALVPFVFLLIFVCYMVSQLATDFKDERLMQHFFLAVSEDGNACQITNITNVDDIQCKKTRTVVAIIVTFVWALGALFSITHALGLVIMIIFCIKHYFNHYLNLNPETAEQNIGSIETPWLVKLDGKFSEENIRNCIELHRVGCDMVRMTNGALKELCFALSAAEVLIIIFSFRGMNLKDPANGLGMKIVLSNLLSYLTFITRAVIASGVNKMVMSSLKVMLKIEPHWGSECPSPKVAKWIKSYVKHVRLDPPSFTGWGLYRITEGCILTVSGHILTYTLTLYGIGG